MTNTQQNETIEVFFTRKEGVVRTKGGEYLEVPADWAHLPPGDAAVTRRVKQAGPSWVVQEKRGRKMFSKGIYAPKATIERELEKRAAEVKTDSYKKKLDSSRKRAAKKQEEYEEEFEQSVRKFLAFKPVYEDLEARFAEVVAAHATPVGSGTVARTKRIPVAQRAEAAVIAWMRHQTTAYDTMHIPRVKGMRREVRRQLAERSRELLDHYRRSSERRTDEELASCPLYRALEK